MKDLKFLKLNKDNFEKALSIKHFAFPESNSDDDYIKYFKNEVKANYYLIEYNGHPCATIGWYDFDGRNKNAFVGWFAVSPQYQNKKIGTFALNYIINEVKSLNYEYLRVYTDKKENYVSTLLYDKLFDLKENYTYPDKIGKTNNFVVYTKFLTNKKEKWNNTPLQEDENYNF
ncbi:MAG: GNAT family N-acetyltransferase [Clostridia bacterium]|nr:GNAT family N-acetyltransferase [Clostridia bacterium]